MLRAFRFRLRAPVRKSVKDLAEEFGFQIGRFNQSYQLDTLPTVITEAEMRPGTLSYMYVMITNE